MNTSFKRFVTVCLLFATTMFVVISVMGRFSSGVFADGGADISMGAILDKLLWPKSVESIEPLSQWTGRYILTSDNNAFLPQALAPFYADVSGTPEPDDAMFYVMHTGFGSAFGSVVYESVTYNYWQHAEGIYMGPLESSEFPYIVDLPLDAYWDIAPAIIQVNALMGLWGVDSVYLMDEIAKVYRIYYEVSSETPVHTVLLVEPDSDQDGNATPDVIGWTIGDYMLWTGQSENRSVIAASLDFDDVVRIPGQPEATARFRPEPNITVDLPVADAFYGAGLADPTYQVFGIIQVADGLYASIDLPKTVQKDSLNDIPGLVLFDDAFLSLHFFKYHGMYHDTPQSIQEITPLATSISIQGSTLLEMPDPIHHRLALWRYPITLDGNTGLYSAPADAKYAPALASDISLTDGIFSATVSQDGLIMPLITELWLDEAVPYVIAANSNIEQPVMLTGFFPTWMGIAPASGVTPTEAETRYDITLDAAVLSFRTPENAIDGFDADYAISPVLDVQTPNTAYLWLPTELTANEESFIQVDYLNFYDEPLTSQTFIVVKNTALILTAVATNVTVTPEPATVALTPEQSALQTATGEYPLEEGRFFSDETVTASVEVDEGWGLVRWLRNGVEAATTPTYEFVAGDEDGVITAAVASYALTIAIQPGTESGEVLLTPQPVVETPGYAPDTEVLLEAQPAAGYVFVGWSGDDAADLLVNPETPHIATLIMDSDKSIEAIFEEGVTLTINAVPPEGGEVFYRIADGSEAPFPIGGTVPLTNGVEITLRAAANSPQYQFDGWRVDDEPVEALPDGTLILVMDTSKSVEALFHGQSALTASVEPPGSGVLSYRIDDDQPQPFPESGILYTELNATVVLLAEPSADMYRFREWTVDEEPAAAGEDGSLHILMDGDKSVVANFGRIVQLTLEPAVEGWVEVISPEPEDCSASDKQTTYCFWVDTTIILAAEAFAPETHVLNAWWINGQELDSTSADFAATHTFVIVQNTTVAVDFKRTLRVDTLSLAAIPVNRSVPLSITGVFPTWMGTDAAKYSKAIALSAEEAEARYEVVVGNAVASFLAPEDTSYTAAGEGINPLDEEDVNATNVAYIWSPAILALPAEADEIPVSIKDRKNPLNIFETALPKEMFVEVVTLAVEILPEETASVVLIVPEQGALPGTDGPSLPLSFGEYVAGDAIMLSAIPRHNLVKYRIVEGAELREVTSPDYELTIVTDTTVTAIFGEDAYKLELVPSEYGIITATPAASPGLPAGWYEADTEIILTAVPNPGWRFVSWTHDLAGQHVNPIGITMDNNKQVGALYLPPDSMALHLIPAEGGSVVLQPAGLVDSANPNVHIYAANTNVRLIGMADTGFRFDRWRILDELGDRFIPNNPWDLRLSKDFVIAPEFAQVFYLDVAASPESGGQIIISPEQPASGYDAGTVVTLTARPNTEQEYRFVQWAGANAADVHPNTTTATVSLAMNSNKQLVARFSRLSMAAIEPAEAWVFGGVVARVTGEALTSTTRIRFGSQEMPLFDIAPSGRYAFVEVPPLNNPGDAESIQVALALIDGDVAISYAPGFQYKQRTVSGSLYTVAFTAPQAGAATPVFVGRIGGRDAVVTVPPLGEAPVYGIVRVALPGVLAASRGDVAPSLPGASQGGLYDVGVHLYTRRIGTAVMPQYGLMSYQDATEELLSFSRPYNVTDASPAPASEPLRINMAVQPGAEPTYADVRRGISLWGVSSRYDYLYNAESVDTVVPAYQSVLQNDEVIPINEPTRAAADTIRALSGARAYGGDEYAAANCFTWRRGSVLPETAQNAIRITAINNMPVSGTGSGPVEGRTSVTLTSPYGGLAWIHSIELIGLSPPVGGTVSARDLISVRGENEFLLEFKTPKSARPGMTSIVIRPASNPEQTIVLQNVFEYTRPPIRWWLILLILIGLMLGVIGMATGF